MRWILAYIIASVAIASELTVPSALTDCEAGRCCTVDCCVDFEGLEFCKLKASVLNDFDKLIDSQNLQDIGFKKSLTPDSPDLLEVYQKFQSGFEQIVTGLSGISNAMEEFGEDEILQVFEKRSSLEIQSSLSAHDEL